jgi:hypothetical protein
LPNRLYVLCRSGDTIPMKELTDHIATGGLLDEDPTFKPKPDSADANDPQWSYLEIVHSPSKRPIQVNRLTGPGDMMPVISDSQSDLTEHCDPNEHPDLEQRIRECRQVFYFELGLDVPDDVWEMLDSAMSYIAKSVDGIVYASDGFFDEDLEPLCKWE